MDKKEKILYGICIVILVWIAISTIEIWIKQKNPESVYSKANCYNAFTTHTTEMRVVGCDVVKADDSFEVVVEDIRGNQYAYYDSEYQYNGTIMQITMRDGQITDAVIEE